MCKRAGIYQELSSLSKADDQPGLTVHTFNLSTQRQRQANLWVSFEPGLHSESQNIRDYVERPCFKQQQLQKHQKPTIEKQKQNQKKNQKQE